MTSRKSWPLAAALGITLTSLSLHGFAAPEYPKEDLPPKADSQVRAVMSNGTWNIDPVHSVVGFSIRHLLINDVHGKFDDYKGTVIVDSNDLSKCSVQFTAKAASVNTNVQQRDDHLRSPDFFDVAKYPELSFTSTKVERLGKNSDNFKVTGVFNMHGVSKVISFPFKVYGPLTDPMGFVRGGIQASLEINRQDYGVKFNMPMDGGGLAVGNIVRINLDLEVIKAGTGPKPK